MFKKIIKKLKDKAKENSEKKKEEKAWKEEVMVEARTEARKEARNVLKEKMKEQEIKRLTADKGDKLKQFGDAFKTAGGSLSPDDKMNRILGKTPGQTSQGTVGFDTGNKMDRILGKRSEPGTDKIGMDSGAKISRILGQQKNKTEYADIIKNNVVIMSSKEQERQDKDERIKRMLR